MLPGVTGTFSANSTLLDGRSLHIHLSGGVVQPPLYAMLHIPIPVVGSPTFVVTSAYWTYREDRITTGTQPASIASATARPKPSWSEACTYTAARR